VSNCEQTTPTLPDTFVSKDDAPQDHLFSPDENLVMEAILKASTNEKVKSKLREPKGETHQKLGKLTNDPTLEGRDENKVGRIERKISRAEKALEK